HEHYDKLTLVPAKAPTVTSPGNKEYYVCGECGKYFGDALGILEITDKNSVIIPALGPAPGVGHADMTGLWIALLAVGTLGLLGTICYRKKKLS
ncbi:MAG: hypothetical protein ACI4EN_10270, partial [Butyrivibrio sp.]